MVDLVCHNKQCKIWFNAVPYFRPHTLDCAQFDFKWPPEIRVNHSVFQQRLNTVSAIHCYFLPLWNVSTSIYRNLFMLTRSKRDLCRVSAVVAGMAIKFDSILQITHTHTSYNLYSEMLKNDMAEMKLTQFECSFQASGSGKAREKRTSMT